MFEVKNVSKAYGGRQVLKDVSFSLAEGGYVCITGESGTGKTTLLNIITGIEKPDGGCVMIDCNPLPEWCRGKYVSYLPCGNSLIESLTVIENIMLAAPDAGDREKAEGLCGMLGITEILRSYPREISAGEYKRACLARAVLPGTPFLVLDEPTSNLDGKSAMLITELLAGLDAGIITATHDPRLIHGSEVRL